MKERLYLASYPLGGSRLDVVSVPDGAPADIWDYAGDGEPFSSFEEAKLKLAVTGLAVTGLAVGKKVEDPRLGGFSVSGWDGMTCQAWELEDAE